MANEKVLPLEQIAAASTPTDSARIVIHDSAGSANYIDLSTLKRLVRESIQIGGRNLLKGTKDFMGFLVAGVGGARTDSSDLGMKEFTTNGAWGKIYQETTIEAGETYVFSTYIKPGTADFNLAWDNNGNATHSLTTAKAQVLKTETINPGSGWCRAVMIIKCTQTGTAQFRVESAQIYSCAGYKLERGNIATDWTPAPEDFGGGKIICRTDSYILPLAAPLEVAHHSEERRAA